MLVAELSDEKIMLKVKDGNLPELTKLFDRYHVRLYNFFLKLTFDKDASEDLTQTLFYRIIKYRHSFKSDDGSFKSWIYQVARNVHIDFCRENKRTNEHFKKVNDNHDNIPGLSDTYSEMDFENLDKALLKLSPDEREILVLSRYQGLKYEEISRIKNISVAAIKVQVHRAMKHLRILYFKQ
jgi:RNA polymerase sigma-70 factor (ECF subfamily)